MQPVVQVPNTNKTAFWVLGPVVFGKHCPGPIKFSGTIKRKIAFLPVLLGLNRVKFNFHIIIVYTKNSIVNW